MPTLLVGEHHGIDVGQRKKPRHQQVLRVSASLDEYRPCRIAA